MIEAFLAEPSCQYGGLQSYRSTTEEPVVYTVREDQSKECADTAAYCTFWAYIPTNLARQKLCFLEPFESGVGRRVLPLAFGQMGETVGLDALTETNHEALPGVDMLSKTNAEDILARSCFCNGSTAPGDMAAAAGAAGDAAPCFCKHILARVAKVELQLKGLQATAVTEAKGNGSVAGKRKCR